MPVVDPPGKPPRPPKLERLLLLFIFAGTAYIIYLLKSGELENERNILQTAPANFNAELDV